MAEPIGSASGGHPDLNLTTEEKRVYGELLKEADPDGFGAVSGDVAVKFFERTRLPADVLGQIWQIADTENRGFLTPSGFGVVLRLIGHAQAGRVPTVTLSPQPAPLPRFDSNGRPPPIAAAAPIPTQYSGTPSSPTVSAPSGPIRVPALTPEKVGEYSALFDKSGAENGYLSGIVAKQIFERARLPNELLGRIWNLADTQGRGSLDVTEFVIAMHLLASCKSGSMRGVPNTLPPGLYEAAARRPQPRMPVPPRPGSASGPPPGIPPQFTGYGVRPQSPGTRPQAGTPLSAQSTGDGWVVTPADKIRFDQAFATVDRQGSGYINGEQAVTFFANARLPEETLAQIWDLADINSEGRLNRDEFAVAMYLIKQQKATKDGRGVLPSKLPPALIPPSMRRQIHPPSQSTAPAFENAMVTQPRSAAEDLFGLDVLSPLPTQSAPLSAPPAPAQIPQSTGGTDAGPFGSPTSPKIAPAAATAAANSIFKPFQPSSSFGQSMIPQSTGSPAPQSRGIPAPQASENLLDDTDANISAKLTNETAELGNLSNQVGTLSKEMTDLQAKRAQADQELSQNAQQKRTFETRLSQLRAAFDKEVKEFKSLQEQLTTSRNETKRLQQDMAMIEGSHADTKRQHDQLRAAYDTDQQENLSLKERMRQLNTENDQIKPQIEKLKSDARQQKGLVAINKKQLATNELERDRLQNELKAAQKEVNDAVREIEETNRQLEASRKALEETRSIPKPTVPVHVPAPVLAPVPVAASIPLPEARSPPVASPTPSTISNPFMRREGSTVFSPPLGSPEPTHDHSAFDSIFGPSFGPVSTAAPSTSFRSETPTNQVSLPESSTKIEHSTPTSITSPDIVEPPAPPTARQITSDSLPLRRPLERTESMTSSVKVVPPASRLSPADTPRAVTPAGFTASGPERDSTDPFTMAAADEEQESVRRTLPRFDTDDRGTAIPGAFPSHTPRAATPVQSVNPVTAVAGAAAAAVVAVGTGLGIVATKEADDTSEDKKVASPPIDTKPSNFDEFFGGPAHQRTPSEQVKDFDAAFASLGPSSAVTNGTTKASDQEFPDIKELDNTEDDEDSSVYSEEAPLGFDDDFTTKSVEQAPPVNVSSPLPPSIATSSAGLPPIESSKAIGKQPEVASAVPSYLQARPALSTASSSASSLPGFEQQTSPPDYKDSVPQDNPAHFPMEYKGLLPTREDPTSPTLPSKTGPFGTGPSSDTVPPAYGPEAAQSQREAVAQTASDPHAAKPTSFDFDSVFASMGPAQVTDDDSDDETTLGSQRTQAPEFDPNFDSPIQSRSVTSASIAQSPITTHSAVTTHDAVTVNGTTSNQNTNSSSFFGFNDSTVTATPTQASSITAPPAVSHDWDALFAPLSSPPAAAATTGNSITAQTSNATNMETQRTEISPEVNARTSLTEVSGGASTPLGPSAATHVPLPPSSLRLEGPAQDKALLQRPATGRALSGGTEHDDPILKRLTAMGWSRTDSLAALEKYDYNIDKAADYLTFRS